jgi:cellulose synthase/poly-beta-1,6-N-acetylglucosamine synthase-like glycosyltransferase
MPTATPPTNTKPPASRRSAKRWYAAVKQLRPQPLRRKRPRRSKLGVHYKGRRYTTHTTLPPADLAVERTVPWQRLALVAITAGVVALFALDWHAALITLVTIITIGYLADLLFGFFLALRTIYRDDEIRVTPAAIDAYARRSAWPKYTIFCPLYRESAVVPQFVRAIGNLDYPKDKLEVQLLLEEDDAETIQEIEAMELPPYFTTLVVPDGLPKTKPKACNYGLQRATGEYAVIYDAEDIPDPLQLKKAVVAFQRLGPEIGCIQAKLNYYNAGQNILTRLFTLEYSLWFDLILTGLQSIRAPIPLGGTSNHFRISDLRAFEGWDPFNVTEDADLGMRIAKRGLHTAVIDSTTMEEANSRPGNWVKQRSRWIKGYMQTYLVHMRRPGAFWRHRKRHLPVFQLVLGGKILALFINPLLWAMTILYFSAPAQTAAFIQSLYLAPIFYMGFIGLVFGNFLYMYYYMLGAARRQEPQLVVFALIVPFYWLMMSWAAVFALRDLLVRPFHWHKTKHGLHLAARKAGDAEPEPLPETAP